MTHSFPTRRSSDLHAIVAVMLGLNRRIVPQAAVGRLETLPMLPDKLLGAPEPVHALRSDRNEGQPGRVVDAVIRHEAGPQRRAVLSEVFRSEEHTSELQSLMRISYAVFCLN